MREWRERNVEHVKAYRAQRAALKRLRDVHRKEYDGYLAEERTKRGLKPLPRRRDAAKEQRRGQLQQRRCEHGIHEVLTFPSPGTTATCVNCGAELTVGPS